MSDIAIDVSHITKRFRLSSGTSLKTALVDRLRGRRPATFTALDDVTFSLHRGETVGLIGHNGAGKSTLFSIITGTLHPTAGSITRNGSISALLELGAGFHPDLTGRENILLYGAIMGIPRETMRQRFDAIVDFSGLRDFIDQPVRFYSSGMYVRLGFAVAVQVNPDILLIDEVLAVGDSEFQAKCLDKMDEFRRAGKSMILISHDINTVRRISDRIAYLSHGHLLGMGDPATMAAQYERDTLAAEARSSSPTNDLPAPLAARHREWGTHEAAFTQTAFLDPTTSTPLPERAYAPATSTLSLRLAWHTKAPLTSLVAGFSIDDIATGHHIFGTNSLLSNIPLSTAPGDHSLTLHLDISSLQKGDYAISFALHSANTQLDYHRIDQQLLLRLSRQLPFAGYMPLPCTWQPS